jgi:CubicO group peptidase (beta-lactamase class C family)
LRAASVASIDPSALQRARDYAAANRSSAFLVWRDGVLEESSYFGETLATSTLTSRSLAKPMTAIAVGRAIALGRIRSLDQPVADFVPEWRDDERRRLILVRHLLDMRSGFLPQSMSPDPAHILNRAYLHPRHDEIIIREYPVVDAPGSRYEYNNASSEMVAVLIERATGRRYAEFISSEILQPIGAPGGQVWVNRPGGVAHSGCCLMLPAEAWLRLGILLSTDGVWQGKRLLPVGYVNEMRRPTRENPYYGLGVYVAGDYTPRRGFAHPEREADSRKVLHSEPYLAPDLFLFDGNANQVVYIIPSERLVILRMGDNPPRGEGQEWDNTVLPNTVLRGILRARAGAALNGPDSR